MLYTRRYESPLGPMTMTSDGELLTGLWFDDKRTDSGSLEPEHEEKDFPVILQTRAWLDLYFQGENPGFTPPLCLKGSPFRSAVWKIMLEIPYGSVSTYGEISQKIAAEKGLARMSARAVGGAAGHNRILLIVPCHRVVGANGNLTGFAAGIERKIALLALEKIDMFRK